MCESLAVATEGSLLMLQVHSVVTTVFVGIYLCYVAVFRLSRQAKLVSWVKACARACMAGTRELIRSVVYPHKDERTVTQFDRKVQVILSQRRKSRAEACFDMYNSVLCALVALVLVQAIGEGIQDMPANRAFFYLWAITWPEMLSTFGITLLASVIVKKCSEILDVTYALHGTALCIWAFVLPNVAAFTARVFYYGFARMVLSLAYGKWRFTALVNLVVSSVFVGAYFQTESRDTSDDLFVLGPWNFAGREAAIYIVITILCYLVERWQAAEVVASLQRQWSTENKSTVTALLNSLCDAVVYLGLDLEIAEPAPKLAGLLLRHGSPKALLGTSFVDLMDSEDASRFKSFVAAETTTECAQSLNVHLKDGSSNLVECRLFHATLRQLDEQSGHIVGVCEVGFADNKPLQELPKGSVRRDVDELTDSSDSSSGYGTPPRSHGNRRFALASTSRGKGASTCSVTCDALTDRLRVLWATVPFAFICGSTVDGLDFLDWVSNASDFRRWVQDRVNCAVYNTASSSQASMPISLVPPLASSLNVRIDMVCTVSSSEVAETFELVGESGMLPISFYLRKSCYRVASEALRPEDLRGSESRQLPELVGASPSSGKSWSSGEVAMI